MNSHPERSSLLFSVQFSVALLLGSLAAFHVNYSPPDFVAHWYSRYLTAPVLPLRSVLELSSGAISPSSPSTLALQSSTVAEEQAACNARMFTPNYAEQIGALQGGSWLQFPIDIWIDAATVRNPDEMQGLRKGLRAWSDGTGGILGVNFTNTRKGAQVEVQMVNSLPGNGSRSLVLGLSTIHTEGDVTTHARLRIVHVSPALLRAIGSAANPQMTRALLTQRIAAHEMGHVLMGTADRHPSESRAILQQDNFAVMLPSAVDINTAKVKYCALFSGK